VPDIATVKALVVDDDRDDARLIRDFLGEAKRSRFVVDVAETAEDCQERIRRNRYDVVLLDYRLPDITGLELMRWFQDNHFRVPVVLITSHGDRRLQTEALEAGCADYLEKGAFQADLLERTCLYAIGLNERQVRNGDGAAGVGLLIQELVSLTRESVTAQAKAADELETLRKAQADNTEAILKEVKKGNWDRFKETLDWMVQHPVPSLVLLLVLLLVVLLLTVLLQVVDVETIKALKGAKTTTGLLENPLGRMRG